MIRNKIYITIIAIVFLAITVVFDTFPRSTVSELEKRELAAFPEFSWEKLTDGSFTKEISSWFSDSEPYRDELMAVSMTIKDVIRLKTSEDNVTFHATADTQPAGSAEADKEEEEEEIDNSEAETESEERNIGEYHNNVTADDNAKIANAGILVVGTGDKVRALMAFGGNSRKGTGYSNAANKYKEVFGDQVNVYCMVIPTAIEFYCPDKARKCTSPQRPVINNMFAHLAPDVKAVDIYTPLGEHASEDIYLRTDHHWAPLGAYYAAKKFAEVAHVPFKDLNSYERRVVHNFVGSMYGYSKDISVKNAPEDFVYYVPKGVKYSTTYINYTIDSLYRVTGEQKPYKGPFFYHFKDGSGGAYSTFMGSDTKITKVSTSTKNGRRVMILKDSFGNALPGYLFFSFEEVHVIDSRYFTKNMIAYVEDNKITDILFANNIFNAYNPKFCKRYTRFLEQNSHTARPAVTDSTRVAPRDSIKAKKDSLKRHHTDVKVNEEKHVTQDKSSYM